MSELIEAFQIFLKYGDLQFPTHCEHDILIVNISPELVSDQDMARLDDLSFFVSTEHEDVFASYRYGSC
jgi:hypothetical protein